jgi:hypothetical protein
LASIRYGLTPGTNTDHAYAILVFSQISKIEHFSARTYNLGHRNLFVNSVKPISFTKGSLRVNLQIKPYPKWNPYMLIT